MYWGIEIATYLFLAGMGAGAFATAIAARRKSEGGAPYERAGYVLGPVAVGIGLLLLIVDAHAGFNHPLRFFYLISNLGSVMTWGVIILSVFMVISFIYLVAHLLKKKLPAALDWLSLAACLGTAAYTGVLLGVIETYPLWNNVIILPLLFVVSATAAGNAAVGLWASLSSKGAYGQPVFCEGFQRLLPFLEAALLVCLLIFSATSSETGRASVMGLLAGAYAPMFWVLVVGCGLVAPVFLEAKLKKAQDKAVSLNIVASVLVLIGGFSLRCCIVLAALPISMPVFG